MQINRIKLGQNDEIILPKKIELFSKDVSTGMVMPADYSPHQMLELEGYEINAATEKKLQKLFKQFDSIVSRHTNDINTTSLLKMEIQTESPPIAFSSLCFTIKTPLICSQ